MNSGPTKRRKNNNTIKNRLRRLFRIEPGEGRTVLLIGGAALATEAGYWMGGNGVDGLTFGRFGSDVLPYLLMLKGILAFVVITFYSRWLPVFNRTRVLVAVTLATLLVLATGRLVVTFNQEAWFFFLLWPLSYVVPDMLMLQIWSLAGESFNSRQNKRLFPLITALGSVGVVAGNFLTYPVVQLIGAPNLIVVWIGLVVLAFMALYTIRRKLDSTQIKRRSRSTAQLERAEQASIAQSLRVGFTVVRYYKIIGLMVIGTTLLYLLYYAMFKIYITGVSTEFQRQYPDQAERTNAITGFFGLVGGCATLLAFAFGLLVVNRLYSRLGVRNLVLVMPLTNLFAFTAIFLFNGFAIVVGSRFVHLLMTQAFSGNVNQTIYNLLPVETREAATPFNNQGISKQGGIFLAGVLLLVASLVSLQLVLALALVLSAGYVLVALRMRALYRPSLVQLLREGQQNFFASGEQDEIEAVREAEAGLTASEDALHAASVGLSDSSEGTRRLSVEMLGQMGTAEAVAPLLKTLFTDSSGEVRRTAVMALVQLKATEAVANIAEALSDPDAPVRAEAALALRKMEVPLDYSAMYMLQGSLADRDPSVRREAALTLLANGKTGEALVTLWEMSSSDEPALRREAAQAFGQISDQVLRHALVELLDDFNPEVRRQAATSLGQAGGKFAVKALLANLNDNDASVREEIARALAHLRHLSVPLLLDYLHTTGTGEGAVCALEALTLAKIEEKKQERARTWERQLYRRYLTAPFPVAPAEEQAATTRALTVIEKPGFDLSIEQQQQLMAYGQQQLDYAARMGGYLAALSALDLAPQPATGAVPSRRNPLNLGVLLKSLRERYDSAILRVVNVVGLLGDVEALSLVATGLQAQGRKAARMRADAIEALENFGDPDLTPRLVQLLEGREETVLMARRPGKTMSDILRGIWYEHDAWLQACVLHVIGLFELRRLRPLVAEAVMVEGESDYLIEETGQEALKMLEGRHPLHPEQNLTIEGWPDQPEANPMQTHGTLSTMSRIMLLQKVPIFANLRPEDLRRVALVCKERLFAPGDILCFEGDPGDELYIVVSGQVQVITGYGNDNQRVLAVNGEGEAVGMMAILDDIPRSATLRAHGGPVRLLILAADEFKRILRERPEMAAEVIRVLSRLLRDTNRRLQESPSFADNLQSPAR